MNELVAQNFVEELKSWNFTIGRSSKLEFESGAKFQNEEKGETETRIKVIGERLKCGCLRAYLS